MIPIDPNRPKSKVQGIIFMMLGGCALSFGTFILAVPIGIASNYRYFFGGMLMLYGAWRLLHGLGIVRRAVEEENRKRGITLQGKQTEG